RPIVEMSEADATAEMSSEATSGMTVIRIAFTKSVPIGATVSAVVSRLPLCEAAMAMPHNRPAMSATRTRVPSFTSHLHHQVAAIDVERRTGVVSRAFRCGEADQVGDLECGAKAWKGIAPVAATVDYIVTVNTAPSHFDRRQYQNARVIRPGEFLHLPE